MNCLAGERFAPCVPSPRRAEIQGTVWRLASCF